MRRLPIVLLAPLLLLLSACSLLTPVSSPADPAPAESVGPATEEDDDFGTVEIYDVLDDGTLSPAASGVTEDVWELFEKIATPEFVSEVMLQYRVGDAPDSDTLAYVYQDDDPDYWILAANLATAEDHELLVGTLIHEYAHILTLATDEFDPAGSCPADQELSEGCPAADSVLADFRTRFWDGYGADAPSGENDDADVAWDFYQEHEEDFVSDYAATNVVEDLAESYMTYVMEDDIEGTGVVAAKLAFFDEYPELSAIRERIRADLGM